MAAGDSVNWDKFLSVRSHEWKPSAIRGLFPKEQIPGMISFLAGKPNPSTFPFEALEVKLKPVVPGGTAETLVLDGAALETGLQYQATAGLGGLVSWLTELTKKGHKREEDGGWRVSVGSGSQDLIYKAFCSLINDGDSVLLETPVYSGTIGLLQPEKIHRIEIPCDTAGLNPDALENTLDNWSTLHPDKPFPKLLYTIPTGSNPTGCSSPIERKERILALVRKHDLLLLEDDPYFFLHYTPETRAPTYFELEARNGGVPGRVVRFDSFSKILSSGMRLGWVTGPKPLLEKMDLMTANTNLQPSSTTQALVLILLNKWGYDGFVEHTHRVAAFYKAKRDAFEVAAKRHLEGLATWVSPDCGMFLYLNLNLNKDGSEGDSSALIGTTAVEKGVLAVPGVGFSPSETKSSYVRVSFSLATEQEADEGLRRLAECIREAREA